MVATEEPKCLRSTTVRQRTTHPVQLNSDYTETTIFSETVPTHCSHHAQLKHAMAAEEPKCLRITTVWSQRLVTHTHTQEQNQQRASSTHVICCPPHPHIHLVGNSPPTLTTCTQDFPETSGTSVVRAGAQEALWPVRPWPDQYFRQKRAWHIVVGVAS